MNNDLTENENLCFTTTTYYTLPYKISLHYIIKTWRIQLYAAVQS